MLLDPYPAAGARAVERRGDQGQTAFSTEQTDRRGAAGATVLSATIQLREAAQGVSGLREIMAA